MNIIVCCFVVLAILLLGLSGYVFYKDANQGTIEEPAPVVLELTPDANYVKTSNMLLKKEDDNNNTIETMHY